MVWYRELAAVDPVVVEPIAKVEASVQPCSMLRTIGVGKGVGAGVTLAVGEGVAVS